MGDSLLIVPHKKQQTTRCCFFFYSIREDEAEFPVYPMHIIHFKLEIVTFEGNVCNGEI